MRVPWRVMALLGLFVCAPPRPAWAQEGARVPRPPGAKPLGPGGQRAPNARQQLERQLGERLAVVVQRQLGLDAAGMRRLQQTNRRFEQERRPLLQQERQARQELRDEMAKGDQANQARVGELMDRAMQLQRQRLDLLASEQRELSTFLTPVQRARYFALQEDLRRRVQEIRRQRATADSSSEPPPLR